MDNPDFVNFVVPPAPELQDDKCLNLKNDTPHVKSKSVYKDPQEAFNYFYTLTKKQEIWDFVRSVSGMMFRGGAKSYQSHKRELYKTVPRLQQYVEVRHIVTGEEKCFHCVKYPQGQYPVTEWEEIYRETRTNIPDLVDLFVSRHRPGDVKNAIIFAAAEGK